MSTEFYPKRGMVFYLEEPSKNQPVMVDCWNKNRPFVVVSNDVSNEKTPWCQVCPITSKPPANAGSAFWMIPVRKKDGSVNWINVSCVLFVPKKLMTPANFSEIFTNVIYTNSDVMTRISYGLAQCLGFPELLKDFNVASTEATTNVTTTAPTITASEGVTVTISIPGSEPIEIKVNNNTPAPVVEPTVPEIQEVTICPPESVTQTPKVKAKVPHTTTVFSEDPKRRRLPKKLKEFLIQTIREGRQSDANFMSAEEIAKKCGVCPATAYRYMVKTVGTTKSSRKTYRKRILTSRELIKDAVLKGARTFGGTKTLDELAEELKVSKTTITRVCHDLKMSGVTFYTPRRRTITELLTKEDCERFVMNYATLTMSALKTLWKDKLGERSDDAMTRIYVEAKRILNKK